jgi:hypothetical protein
MIRMQILMQIIMPRMLRMSRILPLILIIERNKISITEFVYYKFEIIVIFFVY